jgi:hypothetical protein
MVTRTMVVVVVVIVLMPDVIVIVAGLVVISVIVISVIVTVAVLVFERFTIAVRVVVGAARRLGVRTMVVSHGQERRASQRNGCAPSWA